MPRSAVPVGLLALSLSACAAGAGGAPDASRAGGPVGGRAAAAPPGPTYRVYVAAESADLLHRVRFDGETAEVEKTIPVGRWPTETEGPHGLSIAPGGRHLYVTTGHGVPAGMLWKYELGPDTLVGAEVPLGQFPATLDVTPDGLFAFVVNFNLHGEHVPSDISVVYTPEMVEVARTETCTMPHGSRIDPSGLRHYSACMMDDQVVEIDTRTFEVARRFGVVPGAEGPMPLGHADHAAHGAHSRWDSDVAPPPCSPTWVEPSPDGRVVYVACNRSDTVHELDLASWSIRRSFGTGEGPYNLEATPDGRWLLVTLKKQGAVELIDLRTGRSVATSPSSTTVTHGVVASTDSRYAFVSVEGVGAEPGRVDIYDLDGLVRVASVEVGQQAGGIAFWKVER